MNKPAALHPLALRGALGPILGLALVATVPSALVSPAHAQQQSASRSDLAIESDVLHQLASATSLHNQQISASTDNGVVTLTGSVTDDASAQLAQQTASSVAGVRSVVNHLTIGGASASVAPAKPNPAHDAGAAPAPAQDAGAPAAAQDQPAFPQSSQPKSGASGDWGPAGPPPDAQNGQIPPPPSDAQAPAPGAQPGENQPGENGPGENRPGENQPGENQPGAPGDQAGAQNGDQGSLGPPPSSTLPPAGASNPRARNYPPPANHPQPARQPRYGAPVGYGHSAPAAPVTLPAGTILRVRTVDPLDSRRIQQGAIFDVIAAQDIFENGVLAVPRGAAFQGQVLGVKKAGVFRGSAGMALQLTNLNLSGRAYPLATDVFASDTRGKGGYTATNMVGAAAIGAIIGAAAGGGPGAAIGAVAGSAGGAGISAATPSPREVLPPETLLVFHLAAPVTVAPVSYQEAQRLATATERRQPIDSRLNTRYGYPTPPPPSPYPY
ncbi:MAG: BON domain-containing protein [Acidobacteriaceae bacterium]